MDSLRFSLRNLCGLCGLCASAAPCRKVARTLLGDGGA